MSITPNYGYNTCIDALELVDRDIKRIEDKADKNTATKVDKADGYSLISTERLEQITHNQNHIECLGGRVNRAESDIADRYTKAEIDAKLKYKNSIGALEDHIIDPYAHEELFELKVDKEDGHGLISDVDLAQISDNKGDITTLDNRVTTNEINIAKAYTKEEVDTLLVNKANMFDVSVVYSDGCFNIETPPEDLPDKYVLRFTAPFNYKQGDKICVDDAEITIVSIAAPNEPAPDGIFADGALVSFDVDSTVGKAFFKSGVGGRESNGVIEIDYTAKIGHQVRNLSDISESKRYGSEAIIGQKLIAMGGYRNEDGSCTATKTFMVDYETQEITTLPEISARFSCCHMAVGIGNEAIICGGYPNSFSAIAPIEAINVVTGTKRTLTQFGAGRAYTGVFEINGEAVVGCGNANNSSNMTNWVSALNPVTNTVRNIVQFDVARCGSFCATHNGEFIVAGGYIDSNNFSKVIEAANPVTNTKRTILSNLTYGPLTSNEYSTYDNIKGNYMVVMGYSTIGTGGTGEGTDYTGKGGIYARFTEVVNLVTATKRSFMRPIGYGNNMRVRHKSENEVVFDFNCGTNIVKESSLVVPDGTHYAILIYNLDTLDWRIIYNPYEHSDLPYAKIPRSCACAAVFGTEMLVVGGNHPKDSANNDVISRNLVQAVNLGDAGDISIPNIRTVVDGRLPLKVDANVKIPYPATYEGVGYSANTEIPLSDSRIFNLEVPSGLETTEIKYLLQKGEYHL